MTRRGWKIQQHSHFVPPQAKPFVATADLVHTKWLCTQANISLIFGQVSRTDCTAQPTPVFHGCSGSAHLQADRSIALRPAVATQLQSLSRRRRISLRLHERAPAAAGYSVSLPFPILSFRLLRDCGRLTGGALNTNPLRSLSRAGDCAARNSRHQDHGPSSSRHTMEPNKLLERVSCRMTYSIGNHTPEMTLQVPTMFARRHLSALQHLANGCPRLRKRCGPTSQHRPSTTLRVHRIALATSGARAEWTRPPAHWSRYCIPTRAGGSWNISCAKIRNDGGWRPFAPANVRKPMKREENNCNCHCNCKP